MKSVPSQEIAHLGGLGLERTVSAGASVAVERQREGITQGYAEPRPSSHLWWARSLPGSNQIREVKFYSFNGVQSCAAGR
jgi:hypothetical protein